MPVLDVVDLKKSFISPDSGPHYVVDVPKFSLNDGEQMALHGSSGSGKTTFLNLIAGILKADSGSVTIAGANLSSLSEAERDLVRANSIGYVFQTFNLLQGYSALENVLLGMMFGAGADRGRAMELLRRVGLEHRMNHRPREMSVGQQQRVAVARALANRPKLVLADEPTGNLDHKNAEHALSLIRTVCRENGAALLLVSHDRDVLKQFEKVEELSKINRSAS
jgi:putative ABC transport system ATP-binding protein